jgi:type II restriction enzyme
MNTSLDSLQNDIGTVGRRAAIQRAIEVWRADPGGTHQTWFLWPDRLKNFRSIRRGIEAVVEEIESQTFGNVYKGSSLEVAVRSIAEQRQIFKGADHAWLWKPKLRIPDIYESAENQIAFGSFLNACGACSTEGPLLDAIRSLARREIKGLGPTAANLLYFIHPTIVPPFNTAIVNGYNALTGSKVKLGRWDEYLAMRLGILALNTEFRGLLSNDLGAIAGFLFDLGTGRYAAPPLTDSPAERAAWEADLSRVREEAAKADKSRLAARDGDLTHTEVQGWLRDLGIALGWNVWIAVNDVSRPYGGGRLVDGCLRVLPQTIECSPSAGAIRLIDVLWLEKGTGRVAGAFEVEHSTSIYSGIMRMLDLALGVPEHSVEGMYLVAPDGREEEVRVQLARPAFSRVQDLRVRYIAYSDLEKNRDVMGKFGQGMKAVDAIARTLI